MARKVGITAEQVVTTAANHADRGGLSSVSLAAVANDLGVRTPSLYTHVDGLDGLRRDVGIRASHELGIALQAAADAADSPEAKLRALAHAYRQFAIAHPGQYEALLPAPDPEREPDAAAAFAEPLRVVLGVLAELGIAGDQQIDLVRTMRALLHGFVDLENRGGFGMSNPVDASFEVAVDVLVDALFEVPVRDT